MIVDDVRRLTGPNVLARVPLVVVDLLFAPPPAAPLAPSDVDRLLALYLQELGRMRTALGLPASVSAPLVRPFRGGVTFGYSGPEDTLLPSAEMSEWAANSAVSLWTNGPAADLEPQRALFAPMLEAAKNPKMMALVAEAARRALPFLWDDADATVGHGRHSVTYALPDIPAIADVPWDTLKRVPVAMVTGTNGKTTSTRLLAYAAREAMRGTSKVVGVASSDGVIIGADHVERGDWTGPAAARRVLRHHDVDLAVLETARGGILRRGLANADADVSLLTNVSADHLGGFGIDDVDAMAAVKAVVARAATGAVVLNAREPHLVRMAEAAGVLRAPVTYFADLESGDEIAGSVITRHLAAGGSAVFTRDGAIYAARGAGAANEQMIARVEDVPITFHGAARYNVENALGVVAAARGMGWDDAAIARALCTFGSEDNPRRGQLIERRGVRVFLDFGHNPEAVRAAMGVVTTLRKDHKLTVVTASPGDRSNDDMATVARAVFAAKPDRVFVRELPHYLRGRAPGEVPQIFAGAFHDLGLPDSAFAVAASEVDALKRAFDDAKAGDVIAVLVHLDTDDVGAYLASLA